MVIWRERSLIVDWVVEMEHNWDSVRLGGEQGDILLVEWERGDAEVKE